MDAEASRIAQERAERPPRIIRSKIAPGVWEWTLEGSDDATP